MILRLVRPVLGSLKVLVAVGATLPWKGRSKSTVGERETCIELKKDPFQNRGYQNIRIDLRSFQFSFDTLVDHSR
jgi:hypothetical protein